MLGIIGLFCSSAGNFILLFALQTKMDPLQFGTFSLSQVFLYLGISLSNGLFCSPLLIELSRKREAQTICSFAKAFLLFCLAISAPIFLIFLFYSGSLHVGVSISALCVVTWGRWFVRSIEVSDRRVIRPAASDIISGAIVGTTALFLPSETLANLGNAISIQIFSALISLLVFVRAKVPPLSLWLSASLHPFKKSLLENGYWSTVGVVSTELSINSYNYVIGFMLGPTALAPLASVALFFRPVSILAQALSQYGRPHLALEINANSIAAARKRVYVMNMVTIAFVLVNSVVVAGVIHFAPEIVGGGRYARNDLAVIAILTCAINIFFALRMGPSSALQAAGCFRQLALITVATAPVATFGAVAVILIAPSHSAWVLAAVICAEALNALLASRAFKRIAEKTI